MAPIKEKKTALDKIVVKRPALPPELLETAPQPPAQLSAVNPEFQQKPLAEFDTHSSEDFHGGSELTFSMPSQRKSTEDEMPDGQQKCNKTEAYNVVAESFHKPLKHLQTEFYRIVEMIAEERTKHFDPLHGDEYNVKKLLMRRYEGKPLTSYKMYRVRESVMLILDNSGSMATWANMLTALARLAAQRRDVEVYLAPNGHVEAQISPTKRDVSHDHFISRTIRRVIIYVGDFDGGDTPVVLSWHNEVYWLAPEDRYRRFKSHNCVHYDESQFKGFFIRVFTLQEMIYGLKKAMSGVRWIDRCDVCGEERNYYE